MDEKFESFRWRHSNLRWRSQKVPRNRNLNFGRSNWARRRERWETIYCLNLETPKHRRTNLKSGKWFFFSSEWNLFLTDRNFDVRRNKENRFEKKKKRSEQFCHEKFDSRKIFFFFDPSKSVASFSRWTTNKSDDQQQWKKRIDFFLSIHWQNDSIIWRFNHDKDRKKKAEMTTKKKRQKHSTTTEKSASSPSPSLFSSRRT